MRIFLDANILFSAAYSAGAVRRLLDMLLAMGHALIVDSYVCEEAQRNVSAKTPATRRAQAQSDLHDILQRIQLLPFVSVLQMANAAEAQKLAHWLPEKDRPVLLAAIANHCTALVTGDMKHFAAGLGQSYGGVRIYNPALIATEVLALSAS